MSWSTGFAKPLAKAEADSAIDALTTGAQTEAPAMDQLRTAKQAVKTLLSVLPGPYVMVSMGGHANGVGWQKKEGWSNDCISISVTQMTEP